MKKMKIWVNPNKNVDDINDSGMDPVKKKHPFLTLQSITKELSDYKYAIDESSEVVITSPDFIINYVNDNFCHVTKYTKEELIGKDIKIIDSNYHSRKYFEDLYQTISHGDIWKGELRNKTKDGTFYWVDVTVVPFLKEDGTPWQYVSIRKDITARKEAELRNKEITQALTNRNKDLEQFTFIVSHNLRAPIASLIGLTTILSEFDIDDNDRKETIAGISHSARKLDEVIRDLNNILKVKSNSNETEKEVIRLSALVTEVEISLRQYFVNELFTINPDFTNVNEFYSLKSYFHSIFYNLISNVLKFHPPGQECVIEIRSDVKDHKLILSFKDNGPGFDINETGDQLFDLYKRFHLNVDGIGIGIFMVKTQVETLGGTISMMSKKNEGTIFKIEFPF